MATRILSFPADPDAFRRSAAQRSLPGAAPNLPQAAQGELTPMSGSKSAANTSSSQHQASRIARQVEREIAGKAGRQAGERLLARKPPQRQLIVLSPRTTDAFTAGSSQLGLRHRLLDALLFFGRPA